jgi:hypothetical protein
MQWEKNWSRGPLSEEQLQSARTRAFDLACAIVPVRGEMMQLLADSRQFTLYFAERISTTLSQIPTPLLQDPPLQRSNELLSCSPLSTPRGQCGSSNLSSATRFDSSPHILQPNSLPATPTPVNHTHRYMPPLTPTTFDIDSLNLSFTSTPTSTSSIDSPPHSPLDGMDRAESRSHTVTSSSPATALSTLSRPDPLTTPFNRAVLIALSTMPDVQKRVVKVIDVELEIEEEVEVVQPPVATKSDIGKPVSLDDIEEIVIDKSFVRCSHLLK